MSVRLHLLAHNIRSRENVGSLFRTADSLGVTKIWLSGYTPVPPDPKISKVALGAEKSVSFEVHPDIETVLLRLKEAKIPVYALELTPEAMNLADFQPPQEMALLLGTETTGIPPSLLEACVSCIYIPQQGIKESMNVTIATAIAAWKILQ
ncbi:TrmH family RNA methyltransferase [Patescibacteria group bacterium]|nr:TrmH family RNA methyltransferase [Patescibacteria group bacterium]